MDANNRINNSSDGGSAKAITAVIIISSFSSAFLGSAVNIVIPAISADLHVSAAATGWLVTAYALTTCCLSVPFGKLADVTGKNRVYLLGMALLSLSCLASMAAASFPLLVLLRVLQGTGASMIFATNTAIIVSCHRPDQRGKAIGRMLSGTYVGLASGPVISGILNQWLGWHSVFSITGAACLLSLIPAFFFLPVKETDLPAAGKTKTDLAGILLFVLMIGCVMYGFANAGSGRLSFLLIAAGLILLPVFVRAELAADDPLIDVRIFRSTPAYTLSNLSALFNYSAIFGIGYFMSLFLQTDKGFSSQTAGLILICQPLVMALFTSKMGSLSDRIAPYKLATAGMAICGCALIFFSTVTGETPVWAIVCALLATGFGVAVFSSPNMNAIMACVDRSHYGVASSILATMRTLGQTSGIAIITIVFSLRLGDAPLAAVPAGDFESAMHLSFMIFTVICFVGALMSLKRKDAG